MRKTTCLLAFLSIFLITACDKSTDEEIGNTTNPNELKNFYEQYDLQFISRLGFHADDQLNFSEVKLQNMADRKGKINFIAETFFATTGIFAGQVSDNEADLANEQMTVALTNTFINLSYFPNPYTAKNEWDFNKEGKLNVITYLNSAGFFPNYFGGDFGGYYNANDGYQMYSFKSYPASVKGYLRNVNGRMIFADLYRYKAYYENVKDSSWRELPLTVGKYGLSFDFETAASDYGIVASLSTNELNVFAIKDTVSINFASIATSSNVQFAGWDGAFTVAVYKNGSNVNKPYIVIRRNATVDVYLYDIESSKITLAFSDLKLPSEMYFSTNQTFGNCDYFHNFYFGNNLVVLKTGTKLYRLQGNEFIDYQPGFPLEKAMIITCAESCQDGIYLGLSVMLDSGKRVADIVLLQ